MLLACSTLMPPDTGIIPILEVGKNVKAFAKVWAAPSTLPCINIVPGLPLSLGVSHAHTQQITGWSLLASVGSSVSYLVLLGACSDFCHSGLVLISCQVC